MTDYSKMSDFEINKAVFKIQEPNLYKDIIAVCGNDDEKLETLETVIHKDYCNNPSDAWPIICEIWGSLISLTLYDFDVGLGVIQTTIWEARRHMEGGNRLRAAMICYLRMEEGK